MEVTPIGWACIAVGLASLLRPMRLAALLAASVTFSATAVLNFPGVPFGMQPYHWFGGLLALNVAFLQPISLGAIRSAVGSASWVLAFLGWALLSTVAAGTHGPSLVHIGHVSFGVAVLLALRLTVRHEEDALKLLRATVAGAIFASLWGVFQFALHLFAIEYPAFLFNNSVGESAGGYVSTVVEGLLPRVSSVATEPSFLVRSLVPCLFAVSVVPKAIVPLRSAVASARLRAAALSSLLVATLLSTSTTGLVGLAALAGGAVLFVRRHRWKLAVGVLAVVVAAGIAASRSDALVSLGEELVTNKLDLGSGGQRVASLEEAYDAFRANPLLGSGPGFITSDDVLVKLLANYGVAGAACFVLALATAMANAVRVVRQRPPGPSRALVLAWIGANGLLWTMDLVAGLSYTYGIFWVLWGGLGAVSEPSWAPQERDPPRGTRDLAASRC